VVDAFNDTETKEEIASSSIEETGVRCSGSGRSGTAFVEEKMEENKKEKDVHENENDDGSPLDYPCNERGMEEIAKWIHSKKFIFFCKALLLLSTLTCQACGVFSI